MSAFDRGSTAQGSGPWRTVDGAKTSAAPAPVPSPRGARRRYVITRADLLALTARFVPEALGGQSTQRRRHEEKESPVDPRFFDEAQARTRVHDPRGEAKRCAACAAAAGQASGDILQVRAARRMMRSPGGRRRVGGVGAVVLGLAVLAAVAVRQAR